MTLDECKKVFERVSEGAVFDCIDKESYFQFDIIGGDNSESNFYLKFKDGHMSVHEGDYKERDVMLIVTPATLDKIITGRLDPAYAYATRKIKMPTLYGSDKTPTSPSSKMCSTDFSKLNPC